MYVYIYIYMPRMLPQFRSIDKKFFSNQNFNLIIYDTIIAANANHSYSNFTGTNFCSSKI